MLCKLCDQPITDGQRWEYATTYPLGTPEQQKQRVHSACVAAQIQDVLKLMAKVPEDKREEIYFDI